MYFGVVLSPCYGTVEKISIKGTERIYEWETLFSIKTEEGKVELVQTSVSGEIESLEVQQGDYVIPGMVLAYIKEDLFVTGSD
ncbi:MULTISPECIES: biotin/lipoyl-binding protein [Neobacillus]|uniref:Biotin/lipoyl-binding protein n=1 Tax=Neobacillus rhizophilus TaxID=2833579 RepID=A0A942YV04_9BACI|nr:MULTISPECIES: biotin/lipoyl-binding protein [Neobacillus]MBS4213432.1 biotin/lipoyl-binding protein [Neobacillus rhizophilus]MBU8914456.1 biotin/lipoyl-binding protein [Bacillus sp. FJAT-29953]